MKKNRTCPLRTDFHIDSLILCVDARVSPLAAGCATEAVGDFTQTHTHIFHSVLNDIKPQSARYLSKYLNKRARHYYTT